MSVATSARCLLSRRFAATVKPSAAASIPQCYAASFHSSARLEKRRKPRFANVNAKEMGLVEDPASEKSYAARNAAYEAAVDKYAKEQFQPYTPEELEVLKKHYSPEQMEALEAGEAAIDPKDLSIQGRLRRDPYKLPYLDDFSRIVPTIDRQPKTDVQPKPNARWLTDEEHLLEYFEGQEGHLKPLLARTNYTEKEWEAKSPEEKKHIMEEVRRMIKLQQEKESLPESVRATEHFLESSMLNDGNMPSNSALAPGLGKNIPGVSGVYSSPIDPEDQGLDDDGIYQDLKKRTGMSVKQMTDLTCKVLVVRFVHNQTRLGKIRSIWVMAIAGNKNGRLGIGEAKSVENGVAVQKAKLLAIRNMQPIRRYEDRTIHGNVDAKVGATIVKLQARPPGFGLRVPARLFEMFRACGIHDIAGSMPRSRNPMNSVKATFHALTNQKDPNEIAIGRGKKLVDVRKVYFGGNVL
ncbi:37s ribosomal protein s5 [Seiridium cupressi]|uniref:Ribosomal protein s5-like protein n=1 Tax=Seiridium unicorne TaxID=138068 RepID=A0ABR2VCH6_9PEZI